MAATVTRQQAKDALLGLLQASPTFRTVGRRLKFPTDVAEFPAAFVCGAGEIWEERRGRPPKRTLKVDIWVYSDAGKDPDAVPDAALDALIDAVQAALAPAAPQDLAMGVQTLGNLVSHCWIEGDIEAAPGDIDQYAGAVIPVRILLP